MKKISATLNFFLAAILFLSSSQVVQNSIEENLAPQSGFSVVPSDYEPPLKDTRLLTRPEVRTPVLITVLLSFICSFLGCGLPPTRENVADLTQQIHSEIQARRPGNWDEILDRIDERRELIEESGLSREELAGDGGLNLRGIQKEIFLEFGVIVEGAGERDLLHVQDLLRILPPRHYEGFHCLVYGVHYDRLPEHKVAGFYHRPGFEGIISFTYRGLVSGRGSIDTQILSHEMGHFYHIEKVGSLEGLVFWWYHLVCSGNDEDFPTTYAQTNHWEDYAEIYEGWVKDTDSFISDTRERRFDDQPKSEVLIEKILMVARHFLIQRDGKLYLRIYDNMSPQDILLDIEDPEELELFHLYRLRRFVYERDREIEESALDEIFYPQPRQFVDFVLSDDGYQAELVARRIYRMIERINEDSQLSEEEKRIRIIHLI